jgi:biopolymer transport protein ExbB
MSFPEMILPMQRAMISNPETNAHAKAAKFAQVVAGARTTKSASAGFDPDDLADSAVRAPLLCGLRERGVSLALALFALLPLLGRAQGLEAVASNAASDLQRVNTELTAARAAVEADRLPIARRITELEQQLIARRAELARAQRFQENQLVELNALKAEARRASDEVKFTESLITEYAKAFRSRLNFAEEPRYLAMFDAVDVAGASADLAPVQRFSQRTVLLVTALERIERAQGGEIIPGKALDAKGLVQSGKLALVGPVALFAADSGTTAGLLQQELNKADPTVAKLDESLAAASQKLASSGSGELVLDPTLGSALKMSALHKSFYEQLKEGGVAMIPLLGLGLAAILLGFYKWWQLSRVRVATDKDLQQVLGHLNSGQLQQALKHAQSITGIAGEMLATAIDHVDEKKEYIEEVLYEKMLGARTKLERGLPFLALAATTGPLLGLLGTVTGMIATFKAISSFGSGDPKMLAAGISEALICTAAGMAVAIPSLLFHAFLSRRAKGIIGGMEQTAVGFVNGVPDGAFKTPFAQ